MREVGQILREQYLARFAVCFAVNTKCARKILQQSTVQSGLATVFVFPCAQLILAQDAPAFGNGSRIRKKMKKMKILFAGADRIHRYKAILAAGCSDLLISYGGGLMQFDVFEKYPELMQFYILGQHENLHSGGCREQGLQFDDCGSS